MDEQQAGQQQTGEVAVWKERLADAMDRLAATEARLAEKEAFEREQHKIYDSLPVLVATAGLDGYYKRVNAAFERILGWTREESLSRPFIEFIHPEDRPLALEEWKRLKSGVPSLDFLDRNLCRDGSHRWIRWIVIPLPDSGIVYGIGQDITLQRETERELKSARENLEERVRQRTAELNRTNQRLMQEVAERKTAEEQLAIFRTFAETSTQGFGMSDTDGKIVYCNAALARLFGEPSPEATHGKQPSGYYTVDYQSLREAEIFPVLQREGSWQGELTLVDRSGQRIPVLQSSFTLLDDQGQPIRRGVVITDLRGIKQAENRLRASEERYRTLVESSPDAVMMADLDGHLLFASHRAAQMYGVDDPQEMQGRRVEDLVASEDRGRLRRNLQRLLQEGSRSNHEYLCRRSDGSTFPVEASSAVVRDSAGQPAAVMAICRDITERRAAQRAIRGEQDSLRRMLQASDRDLDLITQEMHDAITAPLLAGLLRLEGLAQPPQGTEDQAGADFEAGLAKLREAAARARSLMNRTRTPVLKRFGVKAAIADCIDQMAERPDAPEIVYRCEAEFTRLEPALENAIFRVAQEAITNACVHSGCPLIRVTLTQNGSDLMLDVHDTGVGFDPERIARNRFGLHGIRERTRLIGGTVAIESQPGRGARIRAIFPLVVATG